VKTSTVNFHFKFQFFGVSFCEVSLLSDMHRSQLPSVR